MPGALLGAVVLYRRIPRAEHRSAVAAAAAAVLTPVLGYVLLSRFIWDRPIFAPEGSTVVSTGRQSSAKGTISYLLQFYFPRLPFLQDQIPGRFPVYSIWFKQYVGRFGWLDYSFAPAVTTVALAVWLFLLALGARALAAARAAVGSRLAELATYAAMTVGLLIAIGVPAYDYVLSTTYTFEQIRYLFPLLALYAGLIGLAVRGAGPRWGGAGRGRRRQPRRRPHGRRAAADDRPLLRLAPPRLRRPRPRARAAAAPRAARPRPPAPRRPRCARRRTRARRRERRCQSASSSSRRSMRVGERAPG